jgi:DNA primase
LNSEVQKRRNRKQSGNRTYSLNKNTTQTRGLPEFLSVDSRYGELEYMLLVMLCNDNRLFSKVSKEYNTGAYMDEGARKIAEKLYNRLEQNKNCVLAELLNVLDPKEASYMVRITEINSGLEDTDKAVQQILNKLEILKLEDLQKQTIERIKNEEDGIKRQELGLEFSKRAERIAELKRLT